MSVLVRDGISYSECKLNTTLQAKAVTISTSKTITICLLYLPPSENLNIVLLTHLIVQLPTPFVVRGDFNGHSMTWGCDKNNRRGHSIDDFITDNNVCLLIDGSYTALHTATGTFTIIDLSLCSPNIRMEIDFMVESDSYGSDCFHIIFKIGVSLPDTLPRWNFSRADWVQFDKLCTEKLSLGTMNCMMNLLFCLLMFYVIFLRVVCQELLQRRRSVVSHGLTQNVKLQSMPESQLW